MSKKQLNLQELEFYISDYVEGICAPEIGALPKEHKTERAMEHNFTRLQARIDSEQKAGLPIMDWFKRLFPATLGVALACTLAFNLYQPENNEFTTLSDPSSEEANLNENKTLLRVIFAQSKPQANEQYSTQNNLSQIQDKYPLTLVEGPDSLGSYVFTVQHEESLDELILKLNNESSIAFVGKTIQK